MKGSRKPELRSHQLNIGLTTSELETIRRRAEAGLPVLEVGVDFRDVVVVGVLVGISLDMPLYVDATRFC